MSEHGPRAHVEFDPAYMGVRLALQRRGDGGGIIFRWPDPVTEYVPFGQRASDDGTQPPPWMRLQEDDARAIYEALADYFGHSGNDVRQLRRDYDAERARVDKFITHALASEVSRG